MSIKTLADLFDAETRILVYLGNRIECVVVGTKLNTVLITYDEDGYHSVDPTLEWAYHLENGTLDEAIAFINDLTGVKPHKE